MSADIIVNRRHYLHRVFQVLVIGPICWALLYSMDWLDYPSEAWQRYLIVGLAAYFGALVWESRYIRKFGLSYFPPGTGTLKIRKSASTGRFLSLYELLRFFSYQPGSILIGRLAPEQTLLGLLGLRRVGHRDKRHFLTIAGSQSGKGAAAIIPNLLEYPGSVIVIDPKGELAAVTAARRGKGSRRVRKTLNQRVFVIDPSQQVPGIPCASWNPLDGLDPDSPMIWETASRIAAVLMPRNPTGDANTNYFETNSRPLLTAVIIYQLKTEPSANQNLIFTRRLVTGGDQRYFESLVDNSIPVDDPIHALMMGMTAIPELAGGRVRTAALAFMSAADTERSGILGTLRQHTEFLDNPALERCLIRSDFSLATLRQEPTTVYLCLSATDIAGPMVKILTLFIDLALAAMDSIRNQGKHNLLMVLDEMYILGRSESLDKAMGLVAGMGVTIWPVIQHISQLQAHYPATFDNFLRNCRGVQLFGEQAPDTLKWVESRCGTVTVEHPDKTREQLPFLSVSELSSDFFELSSRRQLYLPASRAPAMLGLREYYRYYPESYYDDPQIGPEDYVHDVTPHVTTTLLVAEAPVTHSVASTAPARPSLPIERPAMAGRLNQIEPIPIAHVPARPRFLVKSSSDFIDLIEGRSVAFSAGRNSLKFMVECSPHNITALNLRNCSGKNWEYAHSGVWENFLDGNAIELSESMRLRIGGVVYTVIPVQLALEFESGDAYALVEGRRIDPSPAHNGPGPIQMIVTTKPGTQNILGIRNIGSVDWSARMPNGNVARVEVGTSVRAVDGVSLECGGMKARIIKP